MDRRIGRALAAVAIGVAAAAAPAAPAAAANPELVIANAFLVNQHQPQPDLFVVGTVTCSQPTGQTEISLLAIQIIGGIGTAAGDTTVACAAGPVSWQVELPGNGLHPGSIRIHGESVRNGTLEAATSESFTLF